MIKADNINVINHKNNSRIVRTGQMIKDINKTSSIAISNNKIIKSIIIIQNLTNIPIPMEKYTRPCLYSFFNGLKKVRSIRGNENSLRNALFKDRK